MCDDIDPDALKSAKEEARFSVEQSLKSYRKISEKHKQILYIDVVLLAGIGSFYFPRETNSLIVISAIFMLSSAGVSMFSYSPKSISKGINTQKLKMVTENGISDTEWNKQVLQNFYPVFLNSMSEIQRSRTKLLKVSQMLLFIALSLLFLHITNFQLHLSFLDDIINYGIA